MSLKWTRRTIQFTSLWIKRLWYSYNNQNALRHTGPVNKGCLCWFVAFCVFCLVSSYDHLKETCATNIFSDTKSSGTLALQHKELQWHATALSCNKLKGYPHHHHSPLTPPPPHSPPSHTHTHTHLNLKALSARSVNNYRQPGRQLGNWMYSELRYGDGQIPIIQIHFIAVSPPHNLSGQDMFKLSLIHLRSSGTPSPTK